MGSGEGQRSRRETFVQATAKYYAPQMQHLSTSHRHRNFSRLLQVEGADVPKISIGNDELRRFSLVQVIMI